MTYTLIKMDVTYMTLTNLQAKFKMWHLKKERGREKRTNLTQIVRTIIQSAHTICASATIKDKEDVSVKQQRCPSPGGCSSALKFLNKLIGRQQRVCFITLSVFKHINRWLTVASNPTAPTHFPSLQAA